MYLGQIDDGHEDLIEHLGSVIVLGALRPVCFVVPGGVLKRQDVFLVVLLVEDLYLPGIALPDPGLEGEIIVSAESF